MYIVNSDGEDFRRWQAGAPEPTWERKQPWLDSLRAEASRGRPAAGFASSGTSSPSTSGTPASSGTPSTPPPVVVGAAP
ncbi:MAG: hypothetical protein M3Z25_08750 [Actinomycetota bacterium]|nr:hypothetical protein [Actinomycetota bacterium]